MRPGFLMRPGFGALEGKVVGIGDGPARRGLGLEDVVGDAVALAIGDRLLRAVEPQPHLLAHVAGAGPAHQRLDLARLLGLVLEHPFFGLGGARLHRRFCRFIDACDHGPYRRSRSLSTPAQGVVGAAGFEPATFWSQTRRATRLRYAPLRRGPPRYTVRIWPARRGPAPAKALSRSGKIIGGFDDRAVSGRRDRAARFPGALRPPSCPWGRDRSGPGHTAPAAIR